MPQKTGVLKENILRRREFFSHLENFVFIIAGITLISQYNNEHYRNKFTI